MEIKHIYWFAYYNLDEPSVRYRAKFPLQQLKDKHGITFSLVYPGYDFKHVSNFLLTFLSALFFRKRHSVIVFQKIYSTGLYATAPGIRFMILTMRSIQGDLHIQFTIL
jgi:hypothetical protein